MANKLTHLDEQGRARMVDVGQKPDTERIAVARGEVHMKPETLELIRLGQIKKGDVLTVAQIAGISAAKRTSELIPLCHPLPLNKVDVDLALDDSLPGVVITATAKTIGKTGVEMEALTAVSELNFQSTLQHQEHLVCLRVIMPDKFSLHLDDLEMIVVHLCNDLR